MKKNWRKICFPGFILIAAYLAACAPLATQENENDTAITHHPVTQKDETPSSIPEVVRPETAKPEAIFFLPPADQPLPAEVTQSLQEILSGLRDKKDILFTLEAWPIADGSREVNISLARQAVTRLRNKLVEMGVLHYRIKASVRGEQRSNTKDDPGSTPEKQRIDMFLSALTS